MKFLERGSFSGSLPELNRFHDTVPLTKESRPFDLKSLFTLTSTLTARFLSGHLSLRHLPLGGRLFLGGVVAFGSVALEKASAQPYDSPSFPRSSYSDVVSDTVINHSALSEGFMVAAGDGSTTNTSKDVEEWGYTGEGFRAIAMNLPLEIVGKAIGPETPLANGDVMQLTENGAMFWRKKDNWTAFTNGERTWVNGPLGLQERGNDEMFEWEWEEDKGKPAEVAGAQATPTVPETIAQPIAVAVPTPIDSRLAPPMGETLRNFFTDTFVKVNRRQFTPDQIINIDGIGIRGKELIDQDYAKRTIKIIQGVPEYYALFKRTVKSLEMYSDAGGNGNIAINDVLGDAGHSVPSRDKILDDFTCGSTAVEFIYDAKLTEIAVNGNIAGRSFKRAPQGSEMERDQQIRWNQAQKAASEVAIDFAIKAKLPEGMLGWYRGNIVRNEAILKNLLQNR